MRFKVGQTVELINNEDTAADCGATAIIKYMNSMYIGVVWKRNEKWHEQRDGGYFPEYFKLVPIKNQQLEFAFMEK